MVGFTLQRAGYSVMEACDGHDALSKLSQAPADMVIADLNMPNMDGIDLIRNLRREPKHRYVPIIMLTTESETTKKQEGRAAGATGWIVKPFTPDQLVSVVSKVLR
jgi:two-component system chemotaxis response regulator CheY